MEREKRIILESNGGMCRWSIENIYY